MNLEGFLEKSLEIKSALKSAGKNSKPHTRALKSEKSLSPPIPVGGGTVDTNDWCITNETGPNALENELT